MDEDEPKEKNLSSGQPSVKANLILQQAINFGEYDPKSLQNLLRFPHNGI